MYGLRLQLRPSPASRGKISRPVGRESKTRQLADCNPLPAGEGLKIKLSLAKLRFSGEGLKHQITTLENKKNSLKVNIKRGSVQALRSELDIVCATTQSSVGRVVKHDNISALAPIFRNHDLDSLIPRWIKLLLSLGQEVHIRPYGLVFTFALTFSSSFGLRLTPLYAK